jgi:CspA family cold shock protein
MLMSAGTVKRFNSTKGFRFVQTEDGSKDVFLHISDVQRAGMEVREGGKIAYDVQSGQQSKL